MKLRVESAAALPGAPNGESGVLRSAAWLGLVLILPVVLSSVGCAPREERRTLPPGAKNLYVAPFGNESSEIGLENLLTEAAVQQFLADGRVNLVEEAQAADVVLRGTITGYGRWPVIFNARDIVQQYRVRMRVRLRLVDPPTGEVLRAVNGVSRRTFYSDRVAPVETEEDAQQRVVDQLARDVVRRTLEGWPYVSDTVRRGDTSVRAGSTGRD